jgi:hypothetical protein
MIVEKKDLDRFDLPGLSDSSGATQYLSQSFVEK